MGTGTNPQGKRRPEAGRGMGVGISGGRRAGKNTATCKYEGPGEGKGGGLGGGTGRIR